MGQSNWLEPSVREQIFREFGELSDRLFSALDQVRDSSRFWEDTVAAVDGFRSRYPYSFVEQMLRDLLESLEQREKQKKEKETEKGASDLAQVSFSSSVDPLPPRLSHLLEEAYRMWDLVRRDPLAWKVYSDVHFDGVIQRLEDYREDLRTARAVFEKA